MTLQACLDYALQHHPSMKEAQLDVQSAEAVVGEVRAIGLPQVNGKLQLLDNYKIQTQFLPAVFFAEDPINNPPPPDAAPIPVQFGTQFMGDAGISISQLVFDGTYFLGLKAADTYTELAREAVALKEADVLANVSKAYYSLLVVRERLEVLRKTHARLADLLRETKAMNENGFVEELDVDRLQVSYNNMANDIARLEKMEASSLALLKFNMGMSVSEPLEVEGDLETLQVQPLEQASFQASDRPEYGVMEVQRKLDLMNIRRYQLGYYPSVVAFFNAGFNSGSNTFEQYKLNGDTWFRYGTLGVQVNIPIFDGLQKKYQIKQAKIDLERTELTMRTLENAFRLEQETSYQSLSANMGTLDAQSANLALANKVVEKTRVKYQAGVGSSLEVIAAETDLAMALGSYYSALYEALMAKVEYDKSLGKLAAQ
jgi:outer membrane protein TolC